MVLKLGFDILIDPPSASSIALLCILYVCQIYIYIYANDESFCWLQILVVKAIGLKSKCKCKFLYIYIWINCEAYVLLKINAPYLLHFSGGHLSWSEAKRTLIFMDNCHGTSSDNSITLVKSLHLSTMWVRVRHFFLGLYLNCYCYTLFLWQPIIILLWLLCCLHCLCGSSIYDSMKFHNLALMKLIEC